jgi:plastocyanin
MRRIVVAALASALSITGLFASPALASDPITFHVQAGSAAFTSGVLGAGNRFYPGSVAIHPGDSLAFNFVGPHTVTFNRPPGPLFLLFAPSGDTNITSPTQSVNSGFVGAPGASYKLTFNVPAGRYKLICGLHLGMTETIDVLPASESLPNSDAQYQAIAQREVARDLAAAAEIAGDARENDEDEDGTPTVFAGAGNRRVTNLAFFPSTVTIRVGQKVTFLKTQDPTEPHTVLFGVEPPGDIAPLIASGGNTYDGSGTVNSGFLSTKAQYHYYQLTGTPLPVAVTKFTVTFTKAGTWDYICALHDGVGMRGNVIVRP